jgi:hypothetical protein
MTDELLKGVMGLLAMVVTAATPVLVGFAIQYLRQKLKQAGLEASDQELETLRKLALEGIAYAAQQAKVDAKLEKPKMSSPEKKALAMSFARKLAEKHGVNGGSIDMLDGVIEAALAKGVIDG